MDVLGHYALNNGAFYLMPIDGGLINRTWIVQRERFGEPHNHHPPSYLLQRINNSIFLNPSAIDNNIRLMCNHLKCLYPKYHCLNLVENKKHETLTAVEGDGFYRMYEYIENATTHQTLSKSDLAYEAAKKFGEFTSLLSGVDVAKIQITLPDFHNVSLRYNQFNTALEHGDVVRIQVAENIIKQAKAYSSICRTYEDVVLRHPDFKQRITHHDTKISNVLFDTHEKGLCVIDLDTVMPGYFISDLGDMFRTYLCPVSEEESDLSRVEVRLEYFQAIVRGYLLHMSGTAGSDSGDNDNNFDNRNSSSSTDNDAGESNASTSTSAKALTALELSHTIYAGKFMIYMQALRFLTDYLNNDVYYGARYEGHNLYRALNQFRLLECYREKEGEMKKWLLVEFGITAV